MATSGFTAADGTVLAAERFVGSGPPIVLLHAGVADSRAWTAVAADLAGRGFDVAAYDRRGFGGTPAAGTPDHVADLGAVITGLGRGPAWLAGNSQGGRIALDLALAEPDLVAGLVLIAPAVSGSPDPGEDELDADTLRIDAGIEAAEEAGDLEAVNRHEAHLWLDGPAAREGRVGGDARDLFLAMNAVALAAEWPDGAEPAEPPTWDRLGEIAAPATVACGELDLPFFRDRCRILADRLPGAREMVEIPGVAHLPGLEDPGSLAALIAEATSAGS